MKRMMKIAGLLMATLLFVACNKEDQTGSMSIRMKDQPIAFEEVNVDIRRVEVHYADGHADKGWITLKTKSGIYNLLELQNGVTTMLVEDEKVPVGHITQMRLILGTENSIKVDGLIHDLQLSSQDETGLKLNLNARVRKNQDIEIFFDFDVHQSIVIEGNGDYRLKPVLHEVSVTYQ